METKQCNFYIILRSTDYKIRMNNYNNCINKTVKRELLHEFTIINII